MRKTSDGDMDRKPATVRDPSDCRRVSEMLVTTDAQLQVTFDAAHDLIVLLDADFRIIRANRAAGDFVGIPAAELVGKHCYNLIHGADKPPADCPLARLFRSRKHEESEHLNERTGTWLSVAVDPVFDENGELVQVVHILKDITERKEREQEIERLGRLYAALSQVNQAIVRVRSREELFRDVVRVLVEFGGFKMVWIGLRNPVTEAVEVAISRGDDTGYLQGIQVFADDRPAGRGPTGTAIREGRPYVCNDFFSDPATTHWREAAAAFGWQSSASFPIRQGGEVIGALSIYEMEIDFFGEREVALLEETALDVSFGLDNLEREARREQAEEDLRRSEEKYRNIYEHAPVGIFQSTQEGRLIQANSTFARLFAYDSPEEMIHTITDIPTQIFVHPGQRAEILRDALETRRFVQHEVTYIRKDRSTFVTNLFIRAVFDENDAIAFYEGFLEDITERKQLEDSLLKSQKFLGTIIETEPECVKLLAADGSLQLMNRAGLEMLQVDSLDQVKGESIYNLIDPEHLEAFRALTNDVFAGGSGSLEFRMVGVKGRPLWLDTHAVPLRNDQGEIVSLLAITRNITERKKYEEQLLYQANYDLLTGLPNRNLLTDRFSQAIAAKERYHSFLALLLMDLDNFKFVNDTLGHAAGDLLLVEVARRIRSSVRKNDTIARLGGDEFVVIPDKVADSQAAARAGEQILAALSEPFFILGREIFLTVSIGIVVHPNDGDSLDQLLQHADIAMYHAKHLGKNNFQFFTATINKRIHDRLALETRLHRALEKNEFLLHYQPQVEIRTGRVVGVEALIRWRPSGDELHLPHTFIPLLEETGLIIPVGEWVLEKACEQLNAWRRAGHDLRLSVNISSRQFHAINIVDRISRIVQSSGCLPGQVCLELTESLIMEDCEANIDKLTHLREMGFPLSMDDFGTGFSSLNYLKRLPLSEIKIDQTFVKGLPANVSDSAIVNSIIHMARYLGMDVVAEGIETEEQMLFLSDNACERGQGYFFSEPLPADEVKL
jgi:diguanylate cyclase (GGDEF)-like protein/PAS domain S-box-containing protein